MKKMPNLIGPGWRKYGFEFLTVFAGVTLAFFLNNWSENRRDFNTETKILTEIRNGIMQDTSDIKLNIKGHENGIEACHYFRLLIQNQPVPDTQVYAQLKILLRDFISLQNKSGYESLKSKGLELITNDSLRLNIISLYDFHYQALEKLEESYSEIAFYSNYFHPINDMLAPALVYDSLGYKMKIQRPLSLTPEQSNKFLMYLRKIEGNRMFAIQYYNNVSHLALEVINQINQELDERE